MELTPQYRARLSTAWWSKVILAGASLLSLLILICDFDWWGALIVAGVVAVTFFEFRVYRYFATGDPRAPGLGFRNQACFAAAILMYGLYHALFPQPLQSVLPQWYLDFIGADSVDYLQGTIRDGYLVVGIVGGLSQFWLAWYYRGAKDA
jgi:hypothetical protein